MSKKYESASFFAKHLKLHAKTGDRQNDLTFYIKYMIRT